MQNVSCSCIGCFIVVVLRVAVRLPTAVGQCSGLELETKTCSVL